MYNFTILIPTHNRNEILNRSFEYYSNYKYLDIIICDSSEKKNEKNFDFVKYLHFPGASFATKLLSALKYVKTKYVILCADDDFLYIDSLIYGQKFLDNNINYSSIQGTYYHFKLNKGKFEISKLYDNAKLKYYTNSKPNIRVLKSVKYGMPLLYALHRIENLNESLEICANLTPITMVEYTVDIITLLNGKHKVFNKVWMLRDSKIYTKYTTDIKSSVNYIMKGNSLEKFLASQNGQTYKSLFFKKFKKNDFNFEIFFNNVFIRIISANVKNNNKYTYFKLYSKIVYKFKNLFKKSNNFNSYLLQRKIININLIIDLVTKYNHL